MIVPSRGRAHSVVAWVAVIAYMGAIFYLSHQPSVPMPMRFPHQDKVFHFTAYFLMAGMLTHAFLNGGIKRRFWLAFLVAALYGITDEIHQSFVPGRDASFWDWLADACGAWVGAWGYLRGAKWRSGRGR
jgi:VanZ family protein